MATRMTKYRSPGEERALQDKRLRLALGPEVMRELQELTVDFNLRHDDGDPVTPLRMVNILIFIEHEKRFPRAQKGA